MGKRKGDQPTPQAQEHAAGEPAGLAPPLASVEAAAAEPAEIEAQEPAKVEAPVVTPPPLPKSESEPVVAATSDETAPIAVAIEPPKLEAVVAPVLPRSEDLKAEAPADETIAPVAPSLLSGWTTSPSWARARRLAPLSATIVIALALGAAAGSFATGGLGSAPTNQPAAQTADARALKDQIARLHADIAALKASIDTSTKSASAQYIKLGDRLDRFEKTQAEPAAKLAKLADAVDRMERRSPTSVAAAAQDITGSVASFAPAPQLAGPPETRPAAPTVLEGWRVRSVYNGAALIQSRVGGVMEVEPGDNVPGLGHVESIRRQDGRWVVVTNKGLIVAR
jgi:hypothetical protein